jgi:hypothetical protein
VRLLYAQICSAAGADEPDTIINPLGIKGLGEIGIVGLAAAIANAVYHATENVSAIFRSHWISCSPQPSEHHRASPQDFSARRDLPFRALDNVLRYRPGRSTPGHYYKTHDKGGSDCPN